MTKGLDISEFQKGIDLGKVKGAGYDFVILRAGYTGTSTGVGKYQDACFEGFYKQAKAAGLKVGAYWYSCANNKDRGVAEAQYMIDNCLKGKTFEYPIYIDVEDPKWQTIGKQSVGLAIQGFCDTLEKAGYYAGVYANINFLSNYIDQTMIKPYDLWLACWSSEKPSIYRSYGMWQSSDKGSVAGYTVDTDEAYLDYPTVIANAGLNGLSKPTVSKPTTPTPQSKPQPQPQKKSVDEIAKEVIQGKWGNGQARTDALKKAGYDANAVQVKVNAMLQPKTQTVIYTVQAGDTLSGIASKYGTTYTKIAKDNGIANPNVIYAGQKLKIIK